MATIAFARGNPTPDALPVQEIAECARAAVEHDGRIILNYGPVGGYPPLREWVAAQHGVEPTQIFLTNGSLQGLSLIASLLVEPGSRVLVEGPTYDRALKIVDREGGCAVTLPMDDDGLDPDALEDGAAFLYTIPTFQNPTGRTLSLERRRRLAELAREGRLLVMEDDPYRHVRFEGEELPTIWELAEGEGVVYSFSFSKIVAPGLRVGYLVAPADLVARIEALAVQTYLSPALLPEATVFEFVQRGLLEPSLERIRSMIGERRDAMLEALAAELPEGSRWSRPEGGYFLWLDLPEETDSRALLARGDEAGVTFVPGTEFFPGGADGLSSARLAYSFVSPAEVRTGVKRLGALLREPAPSVVSV